MVQVIVAILAVSSLAGCAGGLPLMAQANPQTSVKIEPFSKQIEIFSNDGKTFEAMNVKFTSTQEGTTFGADRLSVADRSVENRAANVEQIRAGAEQLAEIRKAVTGCAAEIRRILNPGSGMIDSASPAAVELARIAADLENSATSQPADPHEE